MDILRRILDFMCEHWLPFIGILGSIIVIINNLNSIFDFLKNINIIFLKKKIRIVDISSMSQTFNFNSDKTYFLLNPLIENKADDNNSVGNFALELLGKNDECIQVLTPMTSIAGELEEILEKNKVILKDSSNLSPKSKEKHVFLLFGILSSELIRKDVRSFLLKATDIEGKVLNKKIVKIGRTVNEDNKKNYS